MADRTEAQRRQRAKNVAIGLIVGGTCILFFIITLLRMGGK